METRLKFDFNMEFDCPWIFGRNWLIENDSRLRKRAVFSVL